MPVTLQHCIVAATSAAAVFWYSRGARKLELPTVFSAYFEESSPLNMIMCAVRQKAIGDKTYIEVGHCNRSPTFIFASVSSLRVNSLFRILLVFNILFFYSVPCQRRISNYNTWRFKCT